MIFSFLFHKDVPEPPKIDLEDFFEHEYVSVEMTPGQRDGLKEIYEEARKEINETLVLNSLQKELVLINLHQLINKTMFTKKRKPLEIRMVD